MKYPFSSILLACSAAAAFAGCASQPIFVPLPPTHPASPWACESPVAGGSSTLAIRQSDMLPPHPDWQIPGMRDNEIHGHAAGSPTAMDKMGHGMMMGEGGHGGHGQSGASHAPGMIKMEAQSHKVDYAPKGAVDPRGGNYPEHEPERHLDHTDPERRKDGFKAAPVAPPMDHSGEHSGHQMPADSDDHSGHEMPPAKEYEPESKPAEAMDYSTMDHSTMDHSEQEAPADSGAAPAEDHSQHDH